MTLLNKRYMTVSLDIPPDGINVAVWLSTEEFWASEVAQYPAKYYHQTDSCIYAIHANQPLPEKLLSLVCDIADKDCQKAILKHQKRKTFGGRRSS